MNCQLQKIGALSISIGWLFIAGCATNPAKPTHSFPPPPAEAVRAGLGTIIVESAASETKAYFAKPDSKGKSAAKGAFIGAFYAGEAFGHGSASGSAGGAAVLLELAVLPVGATVGGVVGTVRGTSKAKLKEGESVLARAFADMDFQDSVCQQVLEAGRRSTRRAFIKPGEQAQGKGDAQPRSILEVTVLSAGLAVSGDKDAPLAMHDKDAPLAMFLRVQARLLKSPNEPPLYSNTWVQTSGARPFKEWVADEGRAFREELPKASRAVAESIIEEIFVIYRPGKPGAR